MDYKISRGQAEKYITKILLEYLSALEEAEPIKSKLAPEANVLFEGMDKFAHLIKNEYIQENLYNRLNIKGINELLNSCRVLAQCYELPTFCAVKNATAVEEETNEQKNEAETEAPKLNGKTDLFTLFVNEVSQEIGNVIHIDEGMRITFRLEALDKEEKYKTDWESRKEGGTEEKSFYTLVSLIKNTADDDSMDREMTFEEIGEYKVSARVYKVMKQSLFASLKELVRDYEFKVVVDESDDLYATMDFWDKLFKALKDVNWKEVASTATEEVLKMLPMMVGTIILLSGALVAISMTPIGWLTPVVGVAMQYFGLVNGIKDVLAGLYLFTDAFIQTKEAKSSGAMKQASALFTKAFKYVGPNLLMDILMFFGGKAIKNVKGGNTLEPVKQKPKPTTFKGKNGVVYKQDSNGRWHRPDGHYVSNAEVGFQNSTDHYLHRPYIRKNVIVEVDKNTKINKKTGKIYDEISRKWVDPDKVELGHRPDYEFWYMRKQSEAKKLTQAEFNDLMNNPDFYAWQEIHSNRSRVYENKH